MKRLKIVEQMIIVMVFAVLIPLTTIGIIISNVSQQSVRAELANSATIMAQFVGAAYENYIGYSQSQLNQMASGFDYIPNAMAKIQYFQDIEAKSKLFKNLDIIEKEKISDIKPFVENGNITLYAPIDNQNKYYLTAQINANILETLLKEQDTKGREIYVFDSNTSEIITTNSTRENPHGVLSDLNVEEDVDKTIFGYKKNTPKAYYKINNPQWFVVVDTTKKITAKTINKARFRIILALCLSALVTLIMVGLYTMYLYINIRQLFKGITAISKGNYDKKIHLIKKFFTPHELVFLSKEFNYMANKINISYKDLKKKNKELQKLNDFRQNLVNATSHEFRTPLTSIIGYTSRLLRHDIQLDEETKIKSLQIIKQQAQRLSNMVEDLLVIPELESLSLKYNIEEIDLNEVISRTLEYLKNDTVDFNTDIAPNLNYVYCDEYRTEQILINLIDNAIKYSKDNAPVEIKGYNEENTPVIVIKNKCSKIPEELKEKLFEKFIRADNEMTRTTRGTGLGLYIVKGICEALSIEIILNTDEDFIITLKFNDYVK